MYFTEEHEVFRQSFRDFLKKEVVPHVDRWEEAGFIDKEVFVATSEGKTSEYLGTSKTSSKVSASLMRSMSLYIRF